MYCNLPKVVYFWFLVTKANKIKTLQPQNRKKCLRLRVKYIDFNYNQIVVRDGKGEKDRITVLPKSINEYFKNRLSLYFKNLYDNNYVNELINNYGKFVTGLMYNYSN